VRAVLLQASGAHGVARPTTRREKDPSVIGLMDFEDKDENEDENEHDA
jgi:hypothetical protein